MIKKIIAISCCAFIAANVYAEPNTVTITGKLINNATKDISSPGWSYITARVTLGNPNDAQYIKIAGDNVPSNGAYLDIYYNNPVDYLIDTTHISGKVTIEFYDPNSNFRCAWGFEKGYSSGALLSGDTAICTQTYNDLYMNKRN
jgi:hypothetical protein